jgi:hypothetical protein
MSNVQYDMGGSSSRSQPAHSLNSSWGPFGHDSDLHFDTSTESAAFSQDESPVRAVMSMANHTVEVFSAGPHAAEHVVGVVSPTSSETTQDEQKEPEVKPKRKRENRYKNAPPSVLTVRRANRNFAAT